jgi:hypothetical protein
MNDHWLDRPGSRRVLWRLFIAVLAATVGAELVVALHPHFAVEGWFGFHAWYGFLACAAMVGVAKALGALLKRPDDHYREDDADA